jgi:hypothetical protein
MILGFDTAAAAGALGRSLGRFEPSFRATEPNVTFLATRRGAARPNEPTGGRVMKATWLLSAGVALAFATSASAQEMDFSKVEIITEKLGPNVYMLTGSAGLDPSHEDAAGGRIGVLAGPDGVLMIDSQYVQLADKISRR